MKLFLDQPTVEKEDDPRWDKLFLAQRLGVSNMY